MCSLSFEVHAILFLFILDHNVIITQKEMFIDKMRISKVGFLFALCLCGLVYMGIRSMFITSIFVDKNAPTICLQQLLVACIEVAKRGGEKVREVRIKHNMRVSKIGNFSFLFTIIKAVRHILNILFYLWTASLEMSLTTNCFCFVFLILDSPNSEVGSIYIPLSFLQLVIYYLLTQHFISLFFASSFSLLRQKWLRRFFEKKCGDQIWENIKRLNLRQ